MGRFLCGLLGFQTWLLLLHRMDIGMGNRRRLLLAFLAFKDLLSLPFTHAVCGVRVFKFSPEGSPWNSQARLEENGHFFLSPSTELTVCYRAKVNRYLPQIYWINVFEYFREEDEISNEIRSRESNKRANGERIIL